MNEQLLHSIGHSVHIVLPVPVIPRPEEGIFEFVVRAAAENGFTNANRLWSFINNHGYRHPKFVAWKPAITNENEASLAQSFGCRLEDLSGLSESATSRGLTNFRGIEFRNTLIAKAVRRVAPRALRNGRHLRFAWRLTPLTFDLSTRELLLDRCPRCDQPLGFHSTVGVEYCDKCFSIESWPPDRLDLRDHPQALVDLDDEQAVNFVANLIDPYSDSDQWGRHVADELRVLSRGQLFDFVVTLAGCFQNHGSPNLGARVAPAGLSTPGRPLEPHFVAEAARVMLEWPQGLHRVAEFWSSLHAHINPLLRSLRSSRLPRQFVGRVSMIMRDGRNMTNAIAAMGRGGFFCARAGRAKGEETVEHVSAFGRKPQREIDLISKLRSERPEQGGLNLQARVAVWRAMPDVSQFAQALGLPFVSFAPLCESGVLPPGLLVSPPSSLGFAKAAESVSAALVRMAVAGEPPPIAVRLDVACSSLSFHFPLQWAKVFSALLDGRLRYWRDRRRSKAVIPSIWVEDFTLLRDLLRSERPTWETSALKFCSLTSRDAGLCLCTPSYAASLLQRNGKIEGDLTLANINQFRVLFLRASEITCRMRMNGCSTSEKFVGRMLALQRVTPFRVATYSFYRREDVENRLGARMFPIEPLPIPVDDVK